MPASPFSLDALRDIIVARFPQFDSSRFTLLAEGWDSVAVDVDDRLIFKFPRHPNGEDALRREVRLLDLVREAVAMPVPKLDLYETPRLFSRHEKIAGEHLLAAQYGALPEVARRRLGDALGEFYAQLHMISVETATAAGARPIYPWLTAEQILERVTPVLPQRFAAWAEATIGDWAALPPDPHGLIYGYFDGHGWNMAFDHATGTLNGLYDFADSGIGPLHQEFIYSNYISAEMTERIIDRYELASARQIDRARVDLLTSAQRLWELATEVGTEHEAGMLASVEDWFSMRQR